MNEKEKLQIQEEALDACLRHLRVLHFDERKMKISPRYDPAGSDVLVACEKIQKAIDNQI